jgi:excisionase family DNA binding protein
MEQMLTAEQVAAAFNVSRWTVYRWRKAGLLPSVKVGYVRRYRESDIRALYSETDEMISTTNAVHRLMEES